ncbi:MAG: peptide/nickel transport system substrate-binding protein [Chloroflexota bacterium]|nr:peptide/nickel transport system substrate-binding protein [Chloroflexota bacterium]
MENAVRRSIIAVSLAFLVVAGCAGPAAQPQGGVASKPLSLAVPHLGEPKSLNPNWQADPGTYYPSNQIYSHLVILDWGVTQGTAAYGDLAKDWVISPDGKTYTFNLRTGVTWHDGKPFTSADVVYTFKTIQDKKYPLADYLAGAVVSAPDDKTVVIQLPQPNTAFVPLLAQASNWYGAILPKHIYENTDWATNPANQNPVGTGPFRFVSWDRGSQLTVKANPSYFQAPPQLSTLVFQFVSDPQVVMAGFKSGLYDFVTSDFLPNFAEIKQLKDAGGDSIVVETDQIYDTCLYLNLRNPILADLKVRQALALGIDREALSQQAFSGLFPPNYNAGITSMGAYLNKSAQFPRRDLAKAKALLDQAGYPVKADGTRFKLRLNSYPLPRTKNAAEILVQQLKAMEIDATWTQYDAATWLTKAKAGEYDLNTYFVRYGPDPAAYAEHFGTNAPRNFTGYSNKEVDQWLTDASAITDPAKRKALYDKVQQRIVDDIPYLELVEIKTFSLLRKGWTGFSYTRDGFDKSMSWFGYYNVRRTN